MKEKMKISTFEIEGLVLIEPRLFSDDRGVFYETFQVNQFKEFISEDVNFVQDNESVSKKNVLRGLHFQNPPYAQGKLVRVAKGSVFDVAVDLRVSSSSYGKWFGQELSADNHLQMWIPPGLAHGFLVLSDSAEFLYKTTDFYDPSSEKCLLWNDPTIAVQWPLSQIPNPPQLNAKDLAGLSWGEAPKF
jgi:dTDP-4-dehydrorhamnose 3,5-epimerase